MPTKLMLSADSPLTVVCSKIPHPLVRKIDAAARSEFRTRSDIVRTLVVEAAEARGWIVRGNVDLSGPLCMEVAA